MTLLDDNRAAQFDPLLDREYALRRRHPERDDIYADYTIRSAMSRCSTAARLNIPYGDKHTSTLDLFLPETVNAPPLLVFIHGGYWRALDKAIFSFIADTYVERGVAVAMPNYALAPAASVSDIVEEVCLAIEWLRNEGAAQYGFDPDHMVLSGHSAGGHMASYACIRKQWKDDGRPPQGCVSISGVFDLRPLIQTTINNDLKMSLAEAESLSVTADRLPTTPVLAAVGALETDGFIGQTTNFVERCKAAGLNATSMLVDGRNHFDVLNDFADPEHELFQQTLAMVVRA